MNAIADTLPGLLRRRAAEDPDGLAYTFLFGAEATERSITWSQLDRRAAILAAHLLREGAAGQPVLLALPSGLDFIESLFGCWYAGAIAVPVSLPRHPRLKRRLQAILSDSRARIAIGTAQTRAQLGNTDTQPVFATPATWIDVHAAKLHSITSAPPPVGAAHIALLQYTSGSTGAPRGVVVTHSNLIHNSRNIADACTHEPGDVIAGWLPLFHDMGLIGLVVQAVAAGVRCILMPPEQFLMRPWLWLQMISDYRACSSPAPNFAYELCVERVGPERRTTLDLSCWRTALNGSEPVRQATLERFAETFAGCGFDRRAFFPCYGLAEATLLVSAPRRTRALRDPDTGTAQTIPVAMDRYTGCGRPAAGTELVIADPHSSLRLSAGAIGEIWVRGDSVALGYWNNAQATAATFNGELGPPVPQWPQSGRETDLANHSWLRTGDLGFQDAHGELFITGRLRELIILGGRNHFPADIEATVEAADTSVSGAVVVAFSVDIDDAERLIIVAEVRRTATMRRHDASTGLDTQALRASIRAAVSAEHEIAAFDIVLLRPGAVPRTSSGKIMRLATRDAYLGRTLELLENSSGAVVHN